MNQKMTPERAAYMVAWRDRYIESLQERLAGREEENRMLSALLYYALGKIAALDGEGTVHIPVAEVTAALGRWSCRSEAEGASYAVHFEPRVPACEHGKECGKN